MSSLLLAIACMIAATGCSGTTDARTNPDLEPGSGELGAGDATQPADPGLDGGENGGDGDHPSSVAPPNAGGHPCGSNDARREIETLPSRLYLDGWTLEQRLEALQLGNDPAVAEWFAATRAAAASADEPAVTATNVQRVVCVDDGSATLTLALQSTEGTHLVAGSVMLVDGSWQVTLYAFCRWNPVPACRDTDDLGERAMNALSPALRRASGR